MRYIYTLSFPIPLDKANAFIALCKDELIKGWYRYEFGFLSVDNLDVAKTIQKKAVKIGFDLPIYANLEWNKEELSNFDFFSVSLTDDIPDLGIKYAASHSQLNTRSDEWTGRKIDVALGIDYKSALSGKKVVWHHNPSVLIISSALSEKIVPDFKGFSFLDLHDLPIESRRPPITSVEYKVLWPLKKSPKLHSNVFASRWQNEVLPLEPFAFLRSEIRNLNADVFNVGNTIVMSKALLNRLRFYTKAQFNEKPVYLFDTADQVVPCIQYIIYSDGVDSDCHQTIKDFGSAPD